jgi:UDP-N-acetylmuramoylalanine-D-glutamate ligase
VQPLPRPPVPDGPYLVLGLARAGQAAANALADLAGPSAVRASDTGSPLWAQPELAALRRRGVDVRTSCDGTDLLRSSDRPACVIKSPGVPADAPAVRAAGEAGIPVLDELELGWRLCRSPIVGVTGTNGKSTVCALLQGIARAAGLDAPLAGNTEFGPPLSGLGETRADMVICEVSSTQLEGSPQLLPEAAVLTNLRPEHLDRHGTMAGYGDCKRRLFVRDGRVVPLAVLDVDDDLGKRLAGEVTAGGGRVVTFGAGPGAQFRLRRCGWALDAGWLVADTPDGALELRTALAGRHNAMNALAAAATAWGLGLPLSKIAAGIAATPIVPGRFEPIVEGQPFDVVVDFAHTPDAVEAVIDAARSVTRPRHGDIWAVVSVSGTRVREQGAPIGAATARLADQVIVTHGASRGASRDDDGDPRTPVVEGARSARAAAVALEPDRRVAIRRALLDASPGDLVLVLGRGALDRMKNDASGNGPSFDDRVVVREELAALGFGVGTSKRPPLRNQLGRATIPEQLGAR